MKIYEAPLAEVIHFSASEQLALITDREAADETVGGEPEISIGSVDF